MLTGDKNIEVFYFKYLGYGPERIAMGTHKWDRCNMLEVADITK